MLFRSYSVIKGFMLVDNEADNEYFHLSSGPEQLVRRSFRTQKEGFEPYSSARLC